MESLTNYSGHNKNGIFNNIFTDSTKNSNAASEEFIDANNFDKAQLQAPVTIDLRESFPGGEDERQDSGNNRAIDTLQNSPWDTLASTGNSFIECIMNFENKCQSPWFQNTASSRTQPPMPISPKIKTPAVISTSFGFNKDMDKMNLVPSIRPAGSWECDDDSEIRMMTITGVPMKKKSNDQEDIYRLCTAKAFEYRTSSDSTTKSFNLYRSPAWSEDSSVVPSVDGLTDTSADDNGVNSVPPSPTLLPPSKKKRDGTVKVSKLFNKLHLSPGQRKQCS